MGNMMPMMGMPGMMMPPTVDKNDPQYPQQQAMYDQMQQFQINMQLQYQQMYQTMMAQQMAFQQQQMNANGGQGMQNMQPGQMPMMGMPGMQPMPGMMGLPGSDPSQQPQFGM